MEQNRKNPQTQSNSIIPLLQWSWIALIAALIGNLCVYGFIFLYNIISETLSEISLIPLWMWPVFGALPVGLVVYALVPSSMGEGIPSYLEAVKKKQGVLSFRETVFKFMASLITLGFYGNGGFLGPVGRMSAGFMSSIGVFLSKRGLNAALLPIFPICGMAATLGALFHSPIGGGIFAVEIILKTNMRYKQLFPAILASSVSVYLARSLNLDPVLIINAPHNHLDVKIILIILILTVCAGIAGKFFILIYAAFSKLFKRDHRLKPYLRTIYLIIGSAAASLTLLVNPALIGKSSDLFKAIMENNSTILYGRLPPFFPLFIVLLLLVFAKGLANICTVASGMSAGFTAPAILMGLLMGAAFADLFGVEAGTPEYFSLMAAGFAGYFASIMNTPIAAAIITVELFGLHYSLPAGLAAVVGYMVNQNHTLYDLALEEREERLVDVLD